MFPVRSVTYVPGLYRVAPNTALRLTPNSLFQPGRGGILEGSVSVPALAVSAVWCS